MLLREDIPQDLLPTAEAALAWVNRTRDTSFELTGLADLLPGEVAAPPDEAFELGLVLCDGDICAREQVRASRDGDGWAFQWAEAPRAEIPPLLDPPAGVRSGWIDQQLQAFDFVLLLFYRGRW
jgi:hypothetical protein